MDKEAAIKNVLELILTSAGFKNPKIEAKFLELVNAPKEKIRAIFIPTAAITEEQKAIVPLCKNDLLNAGLFEENIVTYDLDRIISCEEICSFHAIYVCGGSPQYLLNRINETEFYNPLKGFLDNGGVYVGVSAGSIIMANNLPDNLGYINCRLNVHVQDGSKCGYIVARECPEISLTDDQAIIVTGNDVYIIE